MQKPSEIAVRLKSLRGSLTQEEFADKIGVSFRTYQYYEGGVRSPKWPVLAKIAAVCHTSVDWILTGERAGADRVAEPAAQYFTTSDKVYAILKELSEKDRGAVLEFAEFLKNKKVKEGS